MDELLKDILALLHSIQTSPRSSIIDHPVFYRPELETTRVNQLEHRVSACLNALGPPRPPKAPCPTCTESIKDPYPGAGKPSWK